MTTTGSTNEARLLLLDTMAQMEPHLEWALTGLTEQQRYYHSGTANTIAYTAWHAVRGLDGVSNRVCQGKPELWEGKGYRAKLGFPSDMQMRRYTNDQINAMRFEPFGELINYAKDSMRSVVDYLNKATNEDLETVIPNSRIDNANPSGSFSKLRLLRGRITHASMHSGEIYVLRGVQGLQGGPV